jgi:hypothetical protein
MTLRRRLSATLVMAFMIFLMAWPPPARAADTEPEFISGTVTEKYFITATHNLWTGDMVHPDCYGMQISAHDGLFDREQVCVSKKTWDATSLGTQVRGIPVLYHMNWFEKL